MSVLADFGVSGSKPSTIGGPFINVGSGNLVYFPRVQNQPFATPVVFGSGTFNLVNLNQTPNPVNATGQLNYPNNALNGQMARIRIVGTVTTGFSLNARILLQANTSATLQNPAGVAYTTLASTGYQSVTGTAPWSIEAIVSGDSTTGIFSGQYSAMLNGAYHNDTASPTNAWVALDATLSGISFNPAPGQAGVSPVPFGLVVCVGFGTGTNGNAAQLLQFQILDA